MIWESVKKLLLTVSTSLVLNIVLWVLIIAWCFDRIPISPNVMKILVIVEWFRFMFVNINYRYQKSLKEVYLMGYASEYSANHKRKDAEPDEGGEEG